MNFKKKVGFQSTQDQYSLKIIGYCDHEHDAIIHKLRNKKYQDLQNMDGEFTLVYEDGKEVVVVTSLIGAMQYFYYYDGIRFSHGQSIISIANQIDLGWRWDWESIGDLCELENLTENRTLHQDIKRVPAGTILIYHNTLKIRTTKFLDRIKVSDANPVDALKIFNEQTLKWAGKDPVISLSGGFDSRVILSSMLSQGIYPTVVTLGNQQNSDMQVAEMIADKFSLDHIRVQLTVRDFIEKGEYIAYLTNGSKPSCHWHTYLYPKKSGVDKNQSFYVGTLGEFARSYYFDKGFLSLLNDSFSGLAQYRFWLLKLSRHRTFKNEEYSLLCDELKNQINTQGMQNKAKRNASLSSGDFLSGGTRYYLEQRVPNFYANGISMYNSSASWRSPFHNIRWLEKIWNLCDNWKLGSNWHRLAIYRNFPALLEFPEEKGFDTNRMLRKAPPLYWLPIMQKQKYKTYDMSADWFAQPEIQDLIWENNQLIDELIDKKLIRKILDEHVADKTRTRAISFLLTILCFKLSMKRQVQ